MISHKQPWHRFTKVLMQNLNSCTHFRLKDSLSPLNPTEKVLFRPLAFIVLNADITFFCHDQLFIKND